MPTPADSKTVVRTTILSGIGRAGIGVLVFALLIVLYVLEVRREEKRLAPPAGVRNLSAFSAAVPPPSRLKVVEHRGNEYIVWHGERAGPFDVPSGPSCYLFDGTGTLIDWQPETGEGGRIDSFLKSASDGHEITVEEALRMARRSLAAGRLAAPAGQP